jgi:alkylated DNA repair dioxygenase AlkB
MAAEIVQFDLLKEKSVMPQDCLVDHAFLGSNGLDSAQVMKTLIQEIKWEHHQIHLAGRKIKCPRMSFWMGEAVYSYSGTLFTPHPWHPVVFKIKELLEQRAQTQFNSVLMNYYRDGQDHIGFHRDDEVELGDHPYIASISLGATRDFIVKSKGEKWDIPLDDDTLFLMFGDFQKLYQHGIPKRSQVAQPRINLTYRMITPLQNSAASWRS